jgi:hypothetical protein
MSDPILEEIWRVREELIKRHGGLDGYIKYVQKLDRRRQRARPAHRPKTPRQKLKRSPPREGKRRSRMP